MNVVEADLDDIVFEGRNQSYGAYTMRKKYNRLLTRAALIAFLLFIFVTGLPKVVEWLKPEGIEEPADLVVIPVEMELEDLPPPKEREEDLEPPPPPPPVKTPPPAARAQIEFKVIEPAPEEEVDPEETIKDMDELIDADTAMIGSNDVEGIADDGTGEPDWDGLGEGDEPVEIAAPEEDPDPNAFIIAEEEPRPVNMDDIRKLIGYPPMAKEAEIEGKVIVRVLVDKTGKYKKHIVLKDPHPILTKAVETKLTKLQFTPGIQAGKPIKVWVTIPFDFKLLK